jgi:hypothetical protein
MPETPKKLIIDLSKPEGEREQIVELTADEIAQNEADRLKLAQEQAEREAAAEALAALKASAKAKLIAGQPLTAEEADTLVI